VLKKPKPLNNGTWTESEFIAKIQNHLRRFRGWKPPYAVKKAAERKSQSDNKRLKYEYKCACCGNFFASSEIQLDHIQPVIDPLEGFIDWNNYIQRLFVEKEGYQVLCKPCHLEKSKSENEIRHEIKRENKSAVEKKTKKKNGNKN